MVDRTRSGYRCRTVRFVRTVKGDLPRDSYGTIVYELHNLGRHLIFVRWDAGFAVPMLADEIVLENPCNMPVC